MLADNRQTPSGLAILALLHPRFPVQKAYEVLSSAPTPAFGVVHKTFGSNYKNFYHLVDKLLNNPANPDANIRIVIYGDCGPCRAPRRPKGLFPILAKKETINSLNRKLSAGNVKILQQFLTAYTTIRDSLPVNPRITYNFQISLEDNLSTNAHKVLRSLALQVFESRSDVVVGRNPLHFKQAPYPVEIHSYSIKALNKLKAGDIISGDGQILVLGKERCQGLNSGSAKKLVAAARGRGIIPLIWRAEHQGLPLCFQGRTLTPPSRRTYTIKYIKALKKILR